MRTEDAKSSGSYIRQSKFATCEGEYEFAVPDVEHQEIRMTVEDGDGGFAEKIWYVYVAPSKKIQIKPIGPSRSTQVQKYATARGVGRGHIYVDNATALPNVKQFVQEWIFSEGATLSWSSWRKATT